MRFAVFIIESMLLYIMDNAHDQNVRATMRSVRKVLTVNVSVHMDISSHYSLLSYIYCNFLVVNTSEIDNTAQEVFPMNF